jgi:hypothetical protein
MMTTAGWAFMALFWGFIFVFTGWCFKLVLFEKTSDAPGQETGENPPEDAPWADEDESDDDARADGGKKAEAGSGEEPEK